MLNSVIVYML